ncbi:MAG: FHA domain-containing protein [Nitrospinaceae bacterium]
MKFQFIQETRRGKFLRDRSIQEWDQAEILIGRGSSSDIRIPSRLVSFNHARLTLHEGGLFVEDLGSISGILINRRIVTKALLKPGDILKIGDVSLETVINKKGWGLLETRQEVLEKDEKQLLAASLKKLDITRRLPSYGVLSLLLILPISWFFLVQPLKGSGERFWSSGPIFLAHEDLGEGCRSCHLHSFEKVADKACLTCHARGPHSVTLVKTFADHPELKTPCSLCHREHNGRESMIPAKSSICVRCHANIQALHPESTLANIKGFGGGTHPEFHLVRDKLSDRSRIKFNHHRHLSSIEMEGPANGSKREMQCEDCHVPDSSGAHMKPITFKESCSGCHKLVLDKEHPVLEIPHVRPALVRSFLKSPEEFLHEQINGNPVPQGSIKNLPVEKTGFSSNKSKSQEIQEIKDRLLLADRLKNLSQVENKIFFSEKGGCIQCHVLNVSPVMDLHPGSAWLAVSLWDHDVRLYGLESGFISEETLLGGHEDVVTSIRFSARGDLLLTASRDSSARVWDMGGLEKPPRIFKHPHGAVHDARFDATGKMILTGSGDGSAILWDLDSQQAIHILRGHIGSVQKVSFDKEGTRALTWADDYSAILWDAKTGKQVARFKEPFLDVLDARFQPDGMQVAGAMSDGSIRFWEARTGKDLRKYSAGEGAEEPSSGHSREVTGIAFSPDGSRLISFSRDHSAKIWNLHRGSVQATLAVYESNQEGERVLKHQLFLTAEFSRDGSRVLTGSSDNIVRLWDSESGTLIREFKGHENKIHGARFNQDESTIISASYDQTIKVWKLDSVHPRTLHHNPSESAQLHLPAVSPPNIPERFFDKGLFHHGKHKRLICTMCHNAVEDSVFTSDLLLPSIQVCKMCHAKEGTRISQCVQCHRYHPEAKHPPLHANQTG